MQLVIFLYNKYSKVADVYDRPSLSDIFIDIVNASICHRFRMKLAISPKISYIAIAPEKVSLRANQKRNKKHLYTGN